MRYILIPDSFKGTLSSKTVCETMRAAILSVDSGAQVQAFPVADGGEGTAEAFLHAVGGDPVRLRVRGALWEDVEAMYARLDADTAVVEMAAAAGLPQVRGRENPEKTTTYGVGELIGHALEAGVRTLVLGLGGSATNDGGCGMAVALGVRFYDEQGEAFVPVGETLACIERIDASDARARLASVRVRAMCDIDNPLCGQSGAAAVFGPQKGADADMVRRLDAGLSHLADVIARDLGVHVRDLPGAGAAGGMGAGAVAFLGATLEMGIETVLDVVRFDEALRAADVVFTGEGRLDGQSIRGKVVSGVARRARMQQKPVIAVVGSIGADCAPIYDQGVSAVMSINRSPASFEEAAPHSRENLHATMQDVVRLIRTFGNA